MGASSQAQHDSLVKQIDDLPREDQVDILFHLLEMLLPSHEHGKAWLGSGAATDARGQRQRTLDRALGLLATDQPAPTDEEVEQWLEEHRQEKYG